MPPALRALIDRHGPVPFDQLVEVALYDPDAGFYAAAGGRAGRGGDFITSPEVGPLFGAVVANALDEWWRAAGTPARLVVVDAGAGPGGLARAVLAARPACAPALRYVMVERSAAQRAQHATGLVLEDPAHAFADPPDPEADAAAPPSPDGPIVVSVPELPRVPPPVVVLANELLDNLPFRLFERGSDGWAEVLVGLDGDRLVEVTAPADPVAVASIDELAPGAPAGARVPWQRAAVDWLRQALALAGAGGRVVAFDYMATTSELARRPWREWVRTYRRHGRGGGPLEDVGRQDVTCEVALDQLATVRAPAAVRTQAEWLRVHGIDALVEEGRRTWHERAHIGDLAAVRARSRIGESEALLDPAGLGAFTVVEWTG